MKFFKVLIFFIILGGIGFVFFYYKGDFTWTYNAFNKQIENLQKIDVGTTINEIRKEVFAPSPLNIGGQEKDVVLLQSKIITETNLQRQENGNLPPLTENIKLNEAAAAKANDMFLNQYFEHVSPSGVGPGALAQEYGYDYIVEGENLILGNFSSEKDVVQNWMDSPGHRANILNNRYTEMGAAMVKGIYKGETVWIGVQEFGLPLSVCNEPDAGLKTKIDSEKMQLDVTSSELNQERSQIENADKRSSTYKQMVDDYNALVGQYNSLVADLKNITNQYNMQVNAFNNCVAGI